MNESSLRLVQPDYEISTDGRTVWVNGAVCLGRFSPLGVDVHKGAKEQAESGDPCFDCTPTPDWDRFVASMLEHHGIEIPQSIRPGWSA